MKENIKKHIRIRKIRQRLTALALATALVLTGLVAAPQQTQAAQRMVYSHSTMLGHIGSIYFIRSDEETSEQTICRKKVINSSKVSEIVTEEKGILNFVVEGQYLYYTTADEDDQWVIRKCRVDGEEGETLCKGSVFYVDSNRVYGEKQLSNNRSRLFCLDQETGEMTTIRSIKKTQILYYVETIGTDSYYAIYDENTDKISLYRLATADNQFTRITTDKRTTNGSLGAMLVSDVEVVDGELYYDYGSYEGSAVYWYGTIKKLTTDGKKKTIAVNIANEKMEIGSNELYYSKAEGKYYKYQLSDGKKTRYSLDMENGIDYSIIRDKTYMTDRSNKKKIVISRFKSGTARETLTNNFATINFKQKKNISYSVDIQEMGVYYIISVTGTDYTDSAYGWRGHLVSMNWYVMDGAGTIIGSFK